MDQIWWQICAAWFGIAFLVAIAGSAAIWQEDWALARNDALFGVGVALVLLVFMLGVNRGFDAVPMVFVFALGIGLELQKTGIGAWAYADDGTLMLGAKPLFVGFMYASVASYVIRALRLKGLQVLHLPHWGWAALGGIVLYGAYFLALPFWGRPVLILWAGLLYHRARVQSPSGSWLPVPVALGFAALLLWVAENVGTMSGTWTYSGQSAGELVSLSKIGAWFVLLTVIFSVVTYLGRDALWRDKGG
ncbi:MAG: DUF817 family protein [Pseudomonadota bacterium]